MRRLRLLIYVGLILCLLLSATGCGQQQTDTPAPTSDINHIDYLNIDPDRRPVSQKIVLYYKHNASEFLVPVTRNVEKGDMSLEQFVMEELLKGPQGTESQTVVALIPTVTELIDVDISGNTVIVDFTSGISADMPIQSLWGDAYINLDQGLLEQQSRELLLYSIVNTMTELPGISNVKILVDTRAATYTDLGLDAWALGIGATDPEAAIPSYGRSAGHILQPGDVVLRLMEEWKAEQPNWDKIYPFLSSTMPDGTALPGEPEMARQWSAAIHSITVDPESIEPQEMRGDKTALVSVSYIIERANGEKQPVNREYLHLISQGGVWKLEMPHHLLDEDYGY